MRSDPVLLFTIASVTIVGMASAVVLLLLMPPGQGAPTVAVLMAFAGPVQSALLILVQQQGRVTHQVNGVAGKLQSLAERISQLEGAAVAASAPPPETEPPQRSLSP